MKITSLQYLFLERATFISQSNKAGIYIMGKKNKNKKKKNKGGGGNKNQQTKKLDTTTDSIAVKSNDIIVDQPKEGSTDISVEEKVIKDEIKDVTTIKENESVPVDDANKIKEDTVKDTDNDNITPTSDEGEVVVATEAPLKESTEVIITIDTSIDKDRKDAVAQDETKEPVGEVNDVSCVKDSHNHIEDANNKGESPVTEKAIDRVDSNHKEESSNSVNDEVDTTTNTVAIDEDTKEKDADVLSDKDDIVSEKNDDVLSDKEEIVDTVNTVSAKEVETGKVKSIDEASTNSHVTTEEEDTTTSPKVAEAEQDNEKEESTTTPENTKEEEVIPTSPQMPSPGIANKDNKILTPYDSFSDGDNSNKNLRTLSSIGTMEEVDLDSSLTPSAVTTTIEPSAPLVKAYNGTLNGISPSTESSLSFTFADSNESEAFVFLTSSLRELLGDDAKGVSDNTLSRYIRYKPDVQRAAERFRARRLFRKENTYVYNDKSLLLSQDPKLTHLIRNGFVVAPEELHAKDQSHVMIIRGAKCDVGTAPHFCDSHDASRAIFYILQRMMERNTLDPLKGITIILDLSGYTRKNLPSQLAKLLSKAVGCFPIRIQSILVVSMPWWYPSAGKSAFVMFFIM